MSLKDRTVKVKEHFKKYSTAYIVGGVTTVVAGGVCYYLGSKNGTKIISLVAENAEVAQVLAPEISIVGDNNTVWFENWIERSTPSKPVAWLDTDGKLLGKFPSVSEAARVLALDQGAVSKVVSGRSAHVKGHVFKELDLAS